MPSLTVRQSDANVDLFQGSSVELMTENNTIINLSIHELMQLTKTNFVGV